MNIEKLKAATLEEFKAILGEVWGQVTPERREDLGKLCALFVETWWAEAQGQDVSEAKGLLNAALESWKWVGKDVVRKAINKALSHGALKIGSALLF